MRKKRKEKFVDDGRVIANMNVDGMPWVNSSAAYRKPAEKNDEAPQSDDEKRPSPQELDQPLTKKETRGLILNSVLASLLIAGVFIAGAALFILFCCHVWLK